MEKRRLVKEYNNNNNNRNSGYKRGEEAKSPEDKHHNYKNNPQQNQLQQKQQQHCSKMANVVYYLCRNRQVEHPHFMQLPFSSPDNPLFLRDVIERLNALRGRGMASMYSWSCKRSYKNGYVWHDFRDDDLILPVHGNDYVLKGSEFFQKPLSDRSTSVGLGSIKYQVPKQLPEPASSLNGKEKRTSQSHKDLFPPMQCPSSSRSSLDSSSQNDFVNRLANASTQTEETLTRRVEPRETCIRGASAYDGSLEDKTDHTCQARGSSVCSASSSSEQINTLESLIKADVNRINSFRILEKEIRLPINTTRQKPTNLLMQLISCGSISVKDQTFKLTPTYRPRFCHSKFESSLFSNSMMLRQLDCLAEIPGFMGLSLEDRERVNGSSIEGKILKEGQRRFTLRRSSSFNADRSIKELESIEDSNELMSGQSKCTLKSIKASIFNQPRSESMRVPVFEKPRNSLDGTTSNCGSKKITDSASDKNPSKKFSSPDKIRRRSE